MPRRRSRHRRSDRGATMVEFAFILPVLALFTFGVLEVGMIMRSQAQTVAASQAGARTASHPHSTSGPAHRPKRTAYTLRQ